MKRWIISLLALSMMGTAFNTTAHAWPWDKKPSDKETAQPKDSRKRHEDKNAASPASSAVEQPAAASTEPAQPPVEAQNSVTVPKVQVQSPLSSEAAGLKVEDPIESPVIPPEKTFVAVDDPKNPLGITT